VSELAEAVREALARALGASVTFAKPLSGGDINEAFEVGLADGRKLFSRRRPPRARSFSRSSS
jgi:hypothetical protein